MYNVSQYARVYQGKCFLLAAHCFKDESMCLTEIDVAYTFFGNWNNQKTNVSIREFLECLYGTNHGNTNEKNVFTYH